MNLMLRHALPLLEIDILRTFVAIAETGNFTTAADTVYRTPSAVSMQIKKLEETLGAVLFLRDARSVSLTPKGEVLLGYARRMLALNNEAVSRFRNPDLHGVVRLGAPDDIGERLLPQILKGFADSYPSIMVDVTVDMSIALKRRIEEGRLDLTLINSSSQSLMNVGDIVFTERLVWVGAKCGAAHLRDPLPISVWEDGCTWRSEAIAQLERNKRAYRVAYLSAHTMAQRAAVLSDLAVAPFPRSYVSGDMVVLGSQEGLPELPSFNIRMLTAPNLSAPAQAVADNIRFAFGEMARAA